MKLYYTRKLSKEPFDTWHERVLPEANSTFQVYHRSLADQLFSGLDQPLLVGTMERKEDGVYFAPETANIGGVLVHKKSRKLRKNETPLKDKMRLNPNSEVLEVYDIQGNHLATIRITD